MKRRHLIRRLVPSLAVLSSISILSQFFGENAQEEAANFQSLDVSGTSSPTQDIENMPQYFKHIKYIERYRTPDSELQRVLAESIARNTEREILG